MSEVIQNLEVDRSNWGCARTGFIYNQSKLFYPTENDLKGSSDPSHFIFEINVGKGRIRHRTTPNWNEVNFQN